MPELPTPNDQMVDPAISNEDIESWLTEMEESNASYQLPSDTIPLPSTEPVDQQEPDDEPDDEEEPEPQDHFLINGTPFPREDIERLYNFDQYLRANPDAAQRVAAALPSPQPQPEQPPVPPQAEAPTYEDPTPPEYLDLEDPQVRWQWDNHIATQRHLHDQEQKFQKWVEQSQRLQQEQAERQASIDMDAALKDFRQRYPGLNDEDITQIRQAAGPYVGPMMQQLPPVAALTRSMEVAAWAEPDLRSRLESETPTPTTQHKSTTRKQRLNSISGSPRSAPKTEDRVSFSTDKDMVNALANAIAEQGFNPN